MKKKVLFGTSALLAVCMASCGEYDITQNFSKDTKYADDFIEAFGEPDPLQNWTMSKTVDLDIRLSGEVQYDARQIRIYNNDPYKGDANLIAIFDNPEQHMSVDFEIPSDLNYVYVLLESFSGYTQYKPVSTGNKSCEVSFGIADGTRAGARGTGNTQGVNEVDFWKGSVPYGQYDKDEPTDVTTITGNVYEVNHNNISGSKVLLKDATINKINFWSGGVEIYIAGNCTITENWYCGGNTKIYILDGATLNFKQGYQLQLGQWATVWTICNNATMHVDNGIRFEYGQTVYSRGTISTPLLDVVGDGTIYNEGTIEIDNDITLTNDASTIINSGTIFARDLKLQGGSRFYNDHSGKVTLNGLTRADSYNCTWYNRGHYTTANFLLHSASANWQNDCHLTVTEELYIKLQDGAPAIYNKSYVEAGTLYMDNASMQLGVNSQLIVNGLAKFGYNNCDRNEGIFAPESSDNQWAVFKAKAVRADKAKANVISYVGNLIVDCSDHFPQGDDGGVAYIRFKGNAKLAPGGDNYSIPGGDCNKPYNARPLATPNAMPQSWIFACEDLGSTNDYDFNDVVFSISHTEGYAAAYFKPLAAGGTLGAVICYDDMPINITPIDSEIHHMLGDRSNEISGYFAMLNTNRGHSEDYKGDSIMIPLRDKNAKIEEIAEHISVHVIEREVNISSGKYKVSKIVEKPEIGTAPQMIIVMPRWIWAKERTCIEEGYPDFKNWVKDVTYVEWANNAVNPNLVKDYILPSGDDFTSGEIPPIEIVPIQ